jgi:hypothetical protein
MKSGVREPHLVAAQNGSQSCDRRVMRQQRPPIGETIRSPQIVEKRDKQFTDFVVSHLSFSALAVEVKVQRVDIESHVLLVTRLKGGLSKPNPCAPTSEE